MFNIFDKRLKYLKKSKSNLAAKAIDLYNKNERSYKYYCATTNSNENDWDEFKNWIINWVLAKTIDDHGLLQIYLQWVDSQNNLTELSQKRIQNFWYSGGPPGFNKKDDFSGDFWIFVAWASVKHKFNT